MGEGEQGGEEGDSEEGAGEGVEEGRRGVREVLWAIPNGFKVASEPDVLDTNLVGSPVYMRWETYGWQLGRITDVITNATPRLVKKFNYRIIWADGSKGPAKLAVDNYAYSAVSYGLGAKVVPATHAP